MYYNLVSRKFSTTILRKFSELILLAVTSCVILMPTTNKKDSASLHRFLIGQLANIKKDAMKTKDELIELLGKIDRKREFGEYTMTELQKIAERAIVIIKKHNPNSTDLIELDESIKLSDKYHKGLKYKDGDNIMNVLRSTKFAIESFLYKEFGIEI